MTGSSLSFAGWVVCDQGLRDGEAGSYLQPRCGLTPEPGMPVRSHGALTDSLQPEGQLTLLIRERLLIRENRGLFHNPAPASAEC